MTRQVTTWQDRLAWAVIAFALAAILLPRSFRAAVGAPVGTVLLAPLRFVTAAGRALTDRRQENERLSRLATELAVENARLQAQSGAVAPGPGDTLALLRAPVIARDLTTFERYLVVSRGRLHGVRPGSPAVTAEGVVGKVTISTPHQALVQTLLASDARVAVMNLRSRIPGIARPAGAGVLVVDYLPRDADYRVGDTLVTAGLGGVFPKGLRVGVVIDAEPDPDALFRPVRVRPLVNFARIEAVTIISLPESLPPVRDSGAPAAEWLENLAPVEVEPPEEDLQP